MKETMSKNEPRLPIVGEFVRHHGTLIAIEEVPPLPQPPPQTDYIFEEIEARCEMRLSGEVIKEIQTLNDFYGLGTSVEVAIKEMKDYADKRDLDFESDLEVVVVKVVTQFRATPLKEDNFYDKTFFDFRGSINRSNLPNPVETIVWSSKN